MRPGPPGCEPGRSGQKTATSRVGSIVLRKSALLTAVLPGCVPARPPVAQAAMAPGDRAGVLRAADADPELASGLASACPPLIEPAAAGIPVP